MAIQTVNLEKYSVINWSAIFAGALASAAITILLFILGAGLGLSVISPWSNHGVGAATFGISAILWLSITQIISSGMGGFLAGRLRTGWFGGHGDEVYFTDSVHGFITFAIALIVSVVLFTSVIGSALNKGMQSAEMITSAAATTNQGSEEGSIIDETQTYYLESLFRNNGATKSQNSAKSSNMMPEVSRIFSESVKNDRISSEDSAYLSRLITEQTGVTTEQAEESIEKSFQTLLELKTTAKTAADEAREASVYITLWGFIALLMGAYSASYAAIVGGRYRRNDSNIS